MWKNYLSVAFRTLRRNKWYTLVSVLGLGAGIACTVVAYAVFSYAHGFDSFQRNADSIYRVIGIHDWNNAENRFGPVPWDLGTMLVTDCPDARRAVRVNGSLALLKHGNDAVSEYVTFADSGFMEMFTYPLLAGSIDLTRKDQIAISESMAKAYFGSANPIGEVLTFTLRNMPPIQMTVTGVLRRQPSNSIMTIRSLAGTSLLVDAAKGSSYDFTQETWGSFIQVPDPTKVPAVCAQMDKYIAQQTHGVFTQVKRFTVDPLRTVADRGATTRNNVFHQSTPPNFVYGVLASALLILILAGFNYINTSIATSVQRLKEVSVRKVLGATRSQLIAQFLCEHALVCLIAVVVGLCLAEFLGRGLNHLFGFVEIQLNLLHRLDVLVFVLAVGAITAIGSGLYPAWVVSANDPLEILRGRYRAGRLGAVTRVLLVLQFALAMMVVLASIVFLQNADYNRDLDPGYDIHSVLNVEMPDGKSTEVFKQELGQLPGVVSMSGSAGGVGLSTGAGDWSYGGRQHEIVQYFVSSNYLETMKFHLKLGRTFDPSMPSDSLSAIVVNESFLRELGLAQDSAINRPIPFGGAPLTIIGVVEDFLTSGTLRRIQPSVFKVNQWVPESNLHIRVEPSAAEAVRGKVESVWKRLYPDFPSVTYWQEEINDWPIEYSGRMLKLTSLLSSLAILIGMMGLIALVSSNIARRTKEIGIRKVLGAETSQMVYLINRDLILVLIVAVVIADLGGYYVINLFLDGMWCYHVSVGAVAFLAANTVVALIAGLTVSWQVFRAAIAPPIKSLRYE